MADLKNPQNIMELIRFQRDLMRKYYRYMKELLKTQYKKAAILSYWLRDYLNYLKAEVTFKPRFNMSYKRGQIVYVNFGYRVGTELGGCHYAIVLDAHNSQSNSQLTVIPMKSKREKSTSYSSIYHVDLYNEIQLCMMEKSIAIIDEETAYIKRLIDQYGEDLKSNPVAAKELAKSKRVLDHAQHIREFADNKLNHESVADVGQICTISKIRIVHPTQKSDVLHDILLSLDTMSRIEEKIEHLYFSNSD